MWQQEKFWIPNYRESNKTTTPLSFPRRSNNSQINKNKSLMSDDYLWHYKKDSSQ